MLNDKKFTHDITQDITRIKNKQKNKKNKQKNISDDDIDEFIKDFEEKNRISPLKIKDASIINIIENKKSCHKSEIWTHIFSSIKYEFKDDIIITANEIKSAGKTWTGKTDQFEPRLLCKQDSEEDRPEIFKQNNICIISVKNGDYLITKNNIYFSLKYNNDDIITIKKDTESLILSIGNSETSLIDNLRYSGIFETKDFLGEPILYGSLLSGRHRCTFTTKIGNKLINVEGSQYETDGCYESKNKVLLIECKGKNNMESFNIRQLYYPYKAIYDMIKNKKEIIPIFINKNNDNTIHIWKFQFEDPNILTSLKQIDYKVYKFE
jgi:hypothetical protein